MPLPLAPANIWFLTLDLGTELLKPWNFLGERSIFCFNVVTEGELFSLVI